MATPAKRVPADQRGIDATRLRVLENIQDRLLWLSTAIVDHANRLRPNPSSLKVGGHQASSASVISIVTALFFDFMRAGDRISVKPHASPALQAAHYLLGNLEQRYLTTLREFGGLQAYPSRTKDVYPVDFSTGSVGLGAIAPNLAALVHRYVNFRFGTDGHPDRRFLAIVGDTELDEGSIWEAIAEPALANLDNIIWVIDVNRQSLDRGVPGIRVKQLEEMFRANGWTVPEAKYGRRLRTIFCAPGGGALKQRIDDMDNEEYQLLLRSDAATVRRAFGEDVLRHLSDQDVHRTVADLGGHDLVILPDMLASADAATTPAVIFAYTIKGWGLPIAGDPLNHSALLTAEQMDTLRDRLHVSPDDIWSTFPAGSPERALCDERRHALAPPSGPRPIGRDYSLPDDLGRDYGKLTSTQRAFGQILTSILRSAPAAGDRIVTISPDVATSTNFGGWINRVGVWHPHETPDLFTALGPRLIQWERKPKGQHMELGLGISETNLMMALGRFGLAAEMTGEPLLPIGTLYDPFIARALDALIYGLYAGGRFIIVGTPSGVSLAPEGGAHQSVVTPPIGLALPQLV